MSSTTRKLNHPSDLADPNHVLSRVILHSDPLRDLPEAITRACELARGMSIELLANCEEGRPYYVNQRSLDAVLAMIQGTAEHLAAISMDLVGEDDQDLMKADPPPNEEDDQAEEDAFFAMMSGGRLQ